MISIIININDVKIRIYVGITFSHVKRKIVVKIIKHFLKRSSSDFTING